MRNTHESYLNVMHISVPYRLTYFRFPFIYRLSRQSFPLYRQDESSSNKSSRFTFKPRYLVIYDLRERMPEFSTDYPFFFFRSRRKCARTKSPAWFNAVGRNVAWNRAWIGALLDIPAQFGGARENRSNGVAPRSDRDSSTREQFRAWKFQALEMSGKEGKQPFPSSFADYARFQLTIFSSSIWTDGLLLEKFFPPASRGKLVRRKVKEILLLFGFLSCKRVRSYRFELSR